MYKNYFKIAWRNILRNKTSSFINIGGLAVGMAVVILIGLWIWDELSFNKYHTNYERIAQVMTRGTYEGRIGTNSSLQYPLATVLKTKYANNFKHLVIASWVQDYILSVGNKNLSRAGQFVEPGAPEMLSLKMIWKLVRIKRSAFYFDIVVYRKSNFWQY